MSSQVPFGDRLAGALFERFPRLGPWLADLESRVLADEIATVAVDAPIHVCGLARAGSTVLLETLAAHPDATAHRYADFPLIWTPYWWNHLRSRAVRGAAVPRERAHRDRIEVTAESPEALEEILWIAHFPALHGGAASDVLEADTAHPAFERRLRDHVRKLLRVRGARRYVCKANYQVTRLPYLLRLFPDARVVVPVRAPLAHVASLAKQDRLFAGLQRADPAARAHLRRAGHFEFGLDKRPIHFGDAAAHAAVAADFAQGRVAAGYARQWAQLYGWLLARIARDERLRAAVLVVRYEDLCADAPAALARIFAHAGLDDAAARTLIADRASRFAAPDYYRPDWTEAEADEVRAITRDVAAALGY